MCGSLIKLSVRSYGYMAYARMQVHTDWDFEFERGKSEPDWVSDEIGGMRTVGGMVFRMNRQYAK